MRYRYLGSDKFGILSGYNDAISPEEQFTLTFVDGVFNVRTTRDKYISVSEDKAVEIRSDALNAGPESAIRIRMQARFKPTLKAAKEEKAKEKISRAQLEQQVGRKLEDHEVKLLKRAWKDGTFHEALLDIKVKGKHDKFA